MTNAPAASHRPRLRRTLLALHGAFGVLFGVLPGARAADDAAAVAALVEPGSELEIGVRSAGRFSAKADEFSGWRDRGPSFFGRVDLRGGARYDSADTLRWRVEGTQLGGRSPRLEAEVGQQGTWRLTLGAEQLWRNGAEGYQTPYLGAGGSVLTLPSGWTVPVVPRASTTAPNARGLSPEVTASPGIVGGVLTPPTAAQAAAAAALQSADLGAFAPADLFTQRTRHGLQWAQQIGSRWRIDLGWSREHRDGLKAQAAPSRVTGGDTTAFVPAPIDEDDDRLQLRVGYAGERLNVQAGWELSNYSNHVTGLTWAPWSSPTSRATQATAPSNRLRKLSLTANLRPTPATTVSFAAASTRSTQNDALLVDPTAPWVPVASAQARVDGESASLKLQHRASGALQLGAHLGHELRDNRTPVALFGFYDLDNPATGSSPFAYLFPTLKGLGQNFNVNANTPYSRRTRSAGLDADWHVAPLQQLKLGWDGQRTARWCNGSWINCADATDATEHTWRADWRGTLAETVDAGVGVAAARRRVDYDENAFLAVVPMAGQSPSTATGALAGSTAAGALAVLGFNGWGPASGLTPAAAAGSLQALYFPANNALSNVLYANQNRISELPGLRRWNQADRDRDTLRGRLQWQPDERLSLQAALDLRRDDYHRSVYGLQRLAGQALNLDARWTADDRWSLGAFASLERQRSTAAGNTYTANSAATSVNGATAIDGGCFATIAARNAANKVDPCLDWTTTTRDRTFTLGLDAEAKRLLAGRLDLRGSLVLSDARVDTDGTGGSYVNNPYAGIAGAASRDTAAYYVPFASLPAVTVRSVQLDLAATARVSERQALRLTWGWQRLRVRDWAYEGFQDGSLAQALPSREQPPAYDVNRIALSWLLGF